MNPIRAVHSAFLLFHFFKSYEEKDSRKDVPIEKEECARLTSNGLKIQGYVMKT